MSKKVIAYKQLPMRMPFWPSLIAWLLLDRFDPPGWVWGAVATWFALFWIVAVVEMFRQDTVELKELKD